MSGFNHGEINNDQRFPTSDQLNGNDNFSQPLIYQNFAPQQNLGQQPNNVPQQNYTSQPIYAPQQNFVPQQNYQVPQQNYQVPQQNYQVPQQNYQVPQQTYQPPQQVIQPNYQPYPQPSTNVIVVQQQQNTPPQQTKPEVIIIQETNTDGYPRLNQTLAMIVLILNIFAPGIGTIVMGCAGNVNPSGWICIGICQLFLTLFVIGWIWAIVTGLLCLKWAR